MMMHLKATTPLIVKRNGFGANEGGWLFEESKRLIEEVIETDPFVIITDGCTKIAITNSQEKQKAVEKKSSSINFTI